MNRFLEGIAVAMTLIGFWFISEGMAIGFTISLFSNLVWIFWGHRINAKGIMLVNSVFIFLNLNGLGVF